MPEREHECLCGVCPPCRRAHRALLTTPATPVELSPLARAVLDDDQDAIDRILPTRPNTARPRRPARAAAPHPIQHPAPRPSITSPATSPSHCPTCGEAIGTKRSGRGGLTIVPATVNGQCEACGMRDHYLATVREVDAIRDRDGKLTGALRARRRKARLHAQRITRNGRAYHLDANHGTNHAYLHFGCRCDACRAWKTDDNAERRSRPAVPA